MDARKKTAAIATLALAIPLGVPAQQDSASAPPDAQPSLVTLVGQVVNATTGRPVDGAVVSMVGSGFGAVTDSAGAFRIPRTHAGPDTIEVRYIGYEPSRTPIQLPPDQTSRVTLLLSPTVVRVADLTVEVRGSRRSAKLAGFIERRERGFGVFFTPRDIRTRNPRLPSDLLRGIPGVTVGRIVHGKAPVYLGRGAQRGCPPAVYLDGVYQSGLDVDDIPPEDLGAVEVYKGAADTPPEFMRLGRTCGAIVIWTPDGPDFLDWDPDLP